jgi:hypothetical protein
MDVERVGFKFSETGGIEKETVKEYRVLASMRLKKK